MGNRVEGKQKKKGVKANVTSKFSAKRKLSRMGKKVKKGTMGPSTEFMTRASVLKKLQITLKDFRRLCILKGIYPRVPPKAPKGSDKVYYDIKDISHLAHEPLLDKFRTFKSFMKKVRKAAGRNQFTDAQKLDSFKPVVRLDHLVKERYPRFIDALRDLDDTLCMIHLFAALPSQGRITAERTSMCKALVSHWQYYLIQSKSVQKTFVSVKGVYFQASIMGENVTWIAPHPFTQGIPHTVDFRVMTTFLDFYEVYMKFVLFKLYNLQGFQYPPVVSQELMKAGCALYSIKAVSLNDAGAAGAMTVSGAEGGDEGAVVAAGNGKGSSSSSSSKKLSKDAVHGLERDIEAMDGGMDGGDEEDDDEEGTAEEQQMVRASLTDAFSLLHGGINSAGAGGASGNVAHDDEENEEVLRHKFGSLSGNEAEDRRASLFKGLRFFINREVNLEWMQLLICSFGGVVGWEGSAHSPFQVTDKDITHQIVDRPTLSNGMKRVSTREYVQPQWIFDSINAQMLLPIHRYAMGSASLPPHLSPFVNDDKVGYLPKYREEILTMINGGVPPTSSTAVVPSSSGSGPSAEEMVEEEEEEEEEAEGEEQVGSDDEEDDEEDEEEPAAAAVAPQKGQKGQKGIVVPKKSNTKVSEEIEEKDLSITMMTKKTKRLYGRMQHGLAKKADELERLNEKRRKIDEKEDGVSTPATKATPTRARSTRKK